MPDIYINDPLDPNDDVVIDNTPLKDLTPEVAEKQVKDVGMKPAHEVLEHPKKDVHKIQGHSHNPLSSFFYFPDGVSFIAQDAKERIVLLLRKHPITNVPWLVLTILMLFAPAVLPYFPILSYLPMNFQFIAVVMWYLLVIAFAFEKFLSWFFNVYIVTDERIFDVDFVNLVYREIAEANLDQIQDVNVVMGSVIRTIFNYGHIQIQTAAAVPNIEFEAVPDPDKVAKIIRELRVEEEQEKVDGRVR